MGHEREINKRHKGTLRSYGYVHYLHFGDSFTEVYISKCTLKMYMYYINYTSIKLFEKKKDLPSFLLASVFSQFKTSTIILPTLEFCTYGQGK